MGPVVMYIRIVVTRFNSSCFSSGVVGSNKFFFSEKKYGKSFVVISYPDLNGFGSEM